MAAKIENREDPRNPETRIIPRGDAWSSRGRSEANVRDTGTLVRRYIERAIIESGAGVTLRDPDVRSELADIANNLNELDEALRIARRLDERLERIERHVVAMIATLDERT
jgi:hypothetical protein